MISKKITDFKGYSRGIRVFPKSVRNEINGQITSNIIKKMGSNIPV